MTLFSNRHNMIARSASRARLGPILGPFRGDHGGILGDPGAKHRRVDGNDPDKLLASSVTTGEAFSFGAHRLANGPDCPEIDVFCALKTQDAS